MKVIKEWKKVALTDLVYVVSELKDVLSLPAVVILSGEVGAGKTTLVQQYSELPETNSPTYSVINEYGDIVHADFYRLEDPEEILHLELPLYVEGKNTIFVEWGKDYFKYLMRELGFDFNYYELQIDIYHSEQIDQSFRNYSLRSIDKFS